MHKHKGLKQVAVNGWFKDLKEEVNKAGFASRPKLKQGGNITQDGLIKWADKHGITMRETADGLQFAKLRKAA